MSFRRLTLVAIGFLAAHSLGLAFFDTTQGLSGIWPGSGVAVGAVLLAPRSSWGAVFGAVFGIALVTNLFAGIAPWVSIGFAASNVVECSIAGAVAHAISGAKAWGGMRGTLAIVSGAALGVIASALLGAGTTSQAGLSPFSVAFRTWTIADFLGILLVAPLVVDWCEPSAAAPREGGNRELAGFSLVWIVVAGFAFTRPHRPDAWNVDPYMLLPLCAWVALRFGRREVSTALVVLGLMTVTGTVQGMGAFGVGIGGPTERLLEAQLYLGITALSVLLLAATQSERRIAAMDAREGQARLRALGDNLPDGMVYQVVREADGTMHFVYVSRGVERIHGLAVEAVLADSSRLYGQLSLADRAKVAEAEEGSLRTLKPFRALAQSTNARGQVRSVLISSSPRELPDGRVLWDGVETDVTELRLAERESLRAAERLSMALRAVRMGIWEWDVATGAVFWSAEVPSLFDLEPGSFAGTYEAYVGLFDPQQREHIQQTLHGILHGDASDFEIEHSVTARDGSLRWLASTGRVHRDAEGRALRLVGTVADVTDRKRAEEAVRKSEEQLRQAQKLESLGTLAGGIAHDFNNILLAIIANAELLRLTHASNGALNAHVEQILAASNRAANLVKKILSFSRKQVQQLVRTVLGEVFTEAVGLLRATLPATIEIEQELDVTLPPVFADPTQLLQVIMNLCTNAAHAMNNRGKILLRADSCTLSNGDASPSPELKPGRYARLTVIDTGHGMGPATIERIFDPFFTTKAQGTGTGLGLAVVFGIVKDHGGVISVESEPGKGTTFTVYLPLLESEVAVESTGKAAPGYGHGELVMFVDDEQVICDAGRELLARAGYRCEICQSSSQAWAALEKDSSRYAAVVTDLTMPGITGLELAARISKLGKPLPVVLTTGFLDSDVAQAIARLQIQQVVSKPYSYGQLTTAVANAIESRRSSAQLVALR